MFELGVSLAAVDRRVGRWGNIKFDEREIGNDVPLAAGPTSIVCYRCGVTQKLNGFEKNNIVL